MLYLTVSNRIRTFEEILADETKVRNILEINLKKIIPADQPLSKPANLTHEQLGELIFDKLKIKPEDCLRFNFTSARYDTREISLQPGIDLSPFVTSIENFYGHNITTRTQSTNIVKVTFRQVPLNVPDEEIIHLCKFYGNPLNNIVHYETLSHPKVAGVSGATRFVEMEMTPGKSFLNFYWMEGPLPGDQGCRVTVLHPGQDRQCGHCLLTKSEGCPGQGHAKVCKELGTKMTRMIDYMSKVKDLSGYESLKTSYARKFPTLGSKNALASDMTENNGDEEDDNQALFASKEHSENQMQIEVLQKQLTQKESEVSDLLEKVNRTELLEKELDDLQKKLNDPPLAKELSETRLQIETLQKQLQSTEKGARTLSHSVDTRDNIINNLNRKLKERDDISKENDLLHAQAKRFCDLSLNKLCTAREALDNFLSDNISDPQFDEFHPSFKFIVAQYSSLLSSPDHYSINPENNEVTIITELFANIDGSDPVVSKNLEHFRDQLKLKLELDCAKRIERRNSVGRGRKSSIPSKSKKRQLDVQNSDTNAKRSPSTHDRA